MWTPEDRRLVGDYGACQARRTPPQHEHVPTAGCPVHRGADRLQWRCLPSPPAFPPWPTAYSYFRAFLEAGVWENLRHHLLVMLREQEGSDPTPTAAIFDTQNVKTTKRGTLSFDAAKKVKGRKRHIAVDTSGFLLGVLVQAVDIQDTGSTGGALLTQIKRLYCWLRAVFADSIYNRMPVILVYFLLGLTLIIVRRIAGDGFILVPRRWVVERSFGWLRRWRRLSKDHEECTDIPEAMVTIAAIRIMLHRLVHLNRRRLRSPDF